MQENLSNIVKNKPVVLYVHAVDTEGPISESLADTFERLRDLFGIDLPATAENLNALQRKLIPLNGQEDDVADCFSKDRLNYIEDLRSLDKTLDDLFGASFRQGHADSLGRPYTFSWFCIDHVGFELNPRRRLLGYNEILRHYVSRLNSTDSSFGCGDSIEWHYHAVPFGRRANQFGLNWSYDNCHIQVLARRLIEYSRFPSCFRAGGWIERPDMSAFLEQWIPFDYSNHRLHGTKVTQPDYASKRFSDWSEARDDWCGYHPSLRNYQVPGELKRSIFRSISIDARAGKLGLDDVELAFMQAREGLRPVLSVTNHDNRDMRPEIDSVWTMIESLRKKYPDVIFLNLTAHDAAMLHLHGVASSEWSMQVEIFDNVLRVVSDRDIFGAQPFLAIKTKDGRYLHDNFSRKSDHEWFYEFDEYTIPFEAVGSVGVSGHDTLGNPSSSVHKIG